MENQGNILEEHFDYMAQDFWNLSANLLSLCRDFKHMINKHLRPIQKSVKMYAPAACQCHEHQASGLGASRFTPPLSDSSRVNTPSPQRQFSIYHSPEAFLYRPSSEPLSLPGSGSSSSTPPLELVTPASASATKGSEEALPFEVTDLSLGARVHLPSRHMVNSL